MGYVGGEWGEDVRSVDLWGEGGRDGAARETPWADSD